MIKGLPNINIYVMNGKKEDDTEDEDKGMLAKMLKKKEKKDAKMMKLMEEMKNSNDEISMKTGGTSHVGGS
jgi:hypothetical protein